MRFLIFCKEGKESRHNTKYWRNREYIGVALGASGYVLGARYKNTSDSKVYFKLNKKRDFQTKK